MKRLIIAILAAFTVSAASAQENATTERIKVYGNCGMCEKRIEKAAKAAGAATANWNEDTKMLIVTFKPGSTTIDKIQKAIAAVGHDTEKEKAPDAVYQELPGCCLYNRNNN